MRIAPPAVNHRSVAASIVLNTITWSQVLSHHTSCGLSHSSQARYHYSTADARGCQQLA